MNVTTQAPPMVKPPSYEQGSYRLQVRLPEAWRDAIAVEAKKKGITASELCRQAIFEQLPKKVQAKLPEVTTGRPKASDCP